MKKITLYENGYEPFIDFFKGIAIIFVVYSHCATPDIRHASGFYFWAAAPTALFMLIHVFHSFRVSDHVKKPNVIKLFKRVFKPFLITQAIIFIGYYLFTGNLLWRPFLHGGIGMGAYFPWVYVQFIFFCYLMAPVVAKWGQKNGWILLLIFMILAQCAELFCCLVNMNTTLYKLLFFRYIFLVYIGYSIVRRGVYLNWTRGVLATLGLLFIIVFQYSDWNLEPLFYNRAWKAYHWPSYLFYGFVLIPCYYMLFITTNKNMTISSFFRKCGVYSYDIFLFQMIWFTLPVKEYMVQYCHVSYVNTLYITLSIIICTFSVIIYKEYLKENLRKGIKTITHSV
ncbi:MAG: hypothetical protein IK148_02300 [Prevotella sp.]|nr:hypothetical protein [Prevotella sp.]